MNIAKLLSLLIAGVLLSGCAELKALTGTEEAPIEERGAVPAARSAPAAAGAVTATAPVPAGPTSATAATVAEVGQLVETHALPAPGSTEAQAMAASPMSPAGVPAIVGVSPEQAAMLRDPANILSKRVVYFDFDSDAIREEFRGLIEAHAGFLKGNGAARIILQGHTDERGSRDYNLALGQRRGESVKQALSLMGVQNEQVETVSLGEEKPVQEGHDEAAWQQNRRAEIHYLGE